MGVGHADELLERRDARKNRFRVGHVLLHRRPFLAVELAGLVQDRVAHPELAHVVQERVALEPAAALGGERHRLGNQVGEERDAR